MTRPEGKLRWLIRTFPPPHRRDRRLLWTRAERDCHHSNGRLADPRDLGRITHNLGRDPEARRRGPCPGPPSAARDVATLADRSGPWPSSGADAGRPFLPDL